MGLADTQVISRIRIHPANPDLVYVRGPLAILPDPAMIGESFVRKDWLARLDSDSVSQITKPAQSTSLWIATIPTSLCSLVGGISRVVADVEWGAGQRSFQINLTAARPGLRLLATRVCPQGVVGRIGVAVSDADSKRVYALSRTRNGGVFQFG
jgi:hypothetical protein